MEWLEFTPWSREVTQSLAMQAARLNTLTQPAPRPRTATVAQAYKMLSMLRRYPSTNPWGHPSAEC
jgi:hypothetical protein